MDAVHASRPQRGFVGVIPIDELGSVEANEVVEDPQHVICQRTNRVVAREVYPALR